MTNMLYMLFGISDIEGLLSGYSLLPELLYHCKCFATKIIIVNRLLPLVTLCRAGTRHLRASSPGNRKRKEAGENSRYATDYEANAGAGVLADEADDRATNGCGA